MVRPGLPGLDSAVTSGHECNAWCEGDLHCGVFYTAACATIHTWVGRPLWKGQRRFVIERYERASSECKVPDNAPAGAESPWLTWWRYLD